LIGRNMSMMARATLTEGYPILRWVQISSFSIDGARYLASCVDGSVEGDTDDTGAIATAVIGGAGAVTGYALWIFELIG